MGEVCARHGFEVPTGREVGDSDSDVRKGALHSPLATPRPQTMREDVVLRCLVSPSTANDRRAEDECAGTAELCILFELSRHVALENRSQTEQCSKGRNAREL